MGCLGVMRGGLTGAARSVFVTLGLAFEYEGVIKDISEESATVGVVSLCSSLKSLSDDPRSSASDGAPSIG